MTNVVQEFNDRLDSKNKESFSILTNEIIKEGINYNNIIKYVIEFMKIIESTGDKGVDKKNLLILIIEKIVQANVPNQFNKKTLFLFTENILPTLIDYIISLDRGDITIHNESEQATCNFLKGMNFCTKK